MGTVKLLDRQGEVDIAKRIEKGERKVYKALSSNRIIRDEIFKIYETAKKDSRVIKEMIDLAMPDDDGTTDTTDGQLTATAVNKINEIMAIFESIAKLDKKIKDGVAKLADPKKLSERTLKQTQKQIEKLELDLGDQLRQIDFTPQKRRHGITKKRKNTNPERSRVQGRVGKKARPLRRGRENPRRDFYRRRLQK